MAAQLINPLFLGVTRFEMPLNRSACKKFAALAEIGEISVIGFNRTFNFARFTESANFYLLPNVPKGMCSFLLMCSAGLIAATILLITGRANVVVAQSPYEGFAGAMAVRMARLFGCAAALVVESHGDFENAVFLYRRTRFTRIYRAAMRRVASFSISRAQALRSISAVTSNQLRSWNPNKPTIQFPAWTDLDLFLDVFNERSVESAPRVLYVGVLAPIKGVDDLLLAFKLVHEDLKTASLKLIGEARTVEYLREINDIVRRLNLEHSVEFVGHKSQTAVADSMRRASVLVVPSLSEGFGRVVLEGMAAGIPVVASAVDGIPELISDGVTGLLVEPHNPRVLAQAITRIINDRGLTSAIVSRARARALELFSKDMYVASYRELLCKALGAV